MDKGLGLNFNEIIFKIRFKRSELINDKGAKDMDESIDNISMS